MIHLITITTVKHLDNITLLNNYLLNKYFIKKKTFG